MSMSNMDKVHYSTRDNFMKDETEKYPLNLWLLVIMVMTHNSLTTSS